ncbi:Menaquinone reductase, molybdopterin-binding-like subunit [bacterium HR23]|nr:Menaquinone reductase, molybdopterin-binding-like subunit [bacterium HR23]
MGITRRDLLKLAGAGALGAIAFNGCRIPDKELRVESPVALPEDTVTGRENWYATLCQQCGAGCGIVVRVIEGRAKKIEGNPDHPLNAGKTCARGQAGVQALYHPDRLHTPLLYGQPVDWETAMGQLVSQIQQNRGRIFLATNPLRGHIAAVAQAFIQAAGGTLMAYEPLEDTVLRTAVKRLFGQDTLPDYDIAHARTVLSFGAGWLETWGSPVRWGKAYGAFRQGRSVVRGTFFHAEPRFSLTSANADLWLPVRPGREGVLALAVAYVLIEQGMASPSATAQLTGGRGLSALSAYQPEQVAETVGISAQRIREVAEAFGSQRPSLALVGGSALAHTNGLFTALAVLSLNALVDNIGREGGVRFNPPPPLDLSGVPPAPLARWRKALEDMGAGRVGLLIIRGANLVYGLPIDPKEFEDLLNGVPFRVFIGSIPEDMAPFGDLVLPELEPLESWGTDWPEPGPGFQTLTFQQAVVRPFRDGKSFGDILLEAGRSAGLNLPWQSMREAVQDGARRLFALGRGSVRAGDEASFLTGVLQRGGWWDTQAQGQGRVTLERAPATPPAPQFAGEEGEFPFHLVPFTPLGIHDGRGAHLPWLQAIPDGTTTVAWQTWVEIHPERAKELGIAEGDWVEVTSPRGSIRALAYLHPAIPPEVVAVPFGFGHAGMGRWANGRGANVFRILAPLTDSETGAFAWSATRVRIRRLGPRQRIPKFEGTVLPVQLEERPIILITREA